MRFAAIIIVSLLVLVSGFFALVYTGVIKLGAKPVAAQVRKLKPGEVWVPYSAREMPAGTLVTAELLTDPKTRQRVLQAVPIKDALAGHAMDYPSLLKNRVLNHDKHAGFAFTEADFFPKGTPAGDTGFIPKDKMAVTLSPAKLLGVRSLKRGDHVDMVSAQKYDPAKIVYPAGQRPIQAIKPLPGVQFKVLVHDGVVVSPVTVLQVVKGGTFKKPKDTTSEEMKIAVGFDEVAGLEEALEEGATVTCFLRSGLPDPDASKQAIVVATEPAPAPEQVPHTVEEVRGPTHTFATVYPAATQPAESPTPAVVGAPPATAPTLVAPTVQPTAVAPTVKPTPPTPDSTKTDDADFHIGTP